MIRGVHTMFYTSDGDATRAFLRDKLRFPFTDVGGGWLIFDMPEADMGCHPADPSAKHGHQTPAAGTHAISFYCDSIEQTVAELKSRGVEFTRPVVDAGFGLVTAFKMPGGVEVDLYQPHYTKNPTKNPQR
jgi:catechol 2,3-dioxygenase-like lactoylglutathione lyase family enzyme